MNLTQLKNYLFNKRVNLVNGKVQYDVLGNLRENHLLTMKTKYIINQIYYEMIAADDSAKYQDINGRLDDTLFKPAHLNNVKQCYLTSLDELFDDKFIRFYNIETNMIMNDDNIKIHKVYSGIRQILESFIMYAFELCYEDYANDEFDEFKSEKDFHDWLHMLDDNEPVEINLDEIDNMDNNDNDSDSDQDEGIEVENSISSSNELIDLDVDIVSDDE